MHDSLINDPMGGMPRLLEIMARLRDPENGCPWDIEQTWQTIAPYTIEEAYEVADAIEREAWGELKGELGDLLLQVVYFAQIGAEEGRFTFGEIADGISDKMVDRHPHVFGDESRDKSAEQQTRDWEVQKARERQEKGEARVLDGVALGLPALLRAYKLQKRAARVGFDWDNADLVLDKIREEAEELAEAAASGSHDRIEDEMGDMLFVLANLARHLGVDPEQALRRTNDKFIRRFNALEDALHASGSSPAEATLDEMDALWNAAKRSESGRD
ncbi:nucleoside triphosphate pyrophosphohydrolase [Tropicimonas sediminicola]|uniref:Nucleoside triphosphate pyrophosphohydrolase n=1 Tax=Tropicimonas sediminicola TaxID=1031541 RepID=A0A239EJJ4_9RHOB|nr:nucleoside triphosphate pyrophosphohydrolase [Tropicimonas sediminicola]SNS44571.1 ATP diphosphatase [Tropicimonas sediminicola]